MNGIHKVLITNSNGFPFYDYGELPDKPVKQLFYTQRPLSSHDGNKVDDPYLESPYTAATSNFAGSLGFEVESINIIPKKVYENERRCSEKDIIFSLTVDMYMNEKNLHERMKRATDKIIFSQKRTVLNDKTLLSDDEKIRLKNVFNDKSLEEKIYEKRREIGISVKNSLIEYSKYGIMGVGILSSSYRIIFYKNSKFFLYDKEGVGSSKYFLKDENNDPILYPENEENLKEVMSSIKIPNEIREGESVLLNSPEKNIGLQIHNYGIGPLVEGAREPSYLIVAVSPSYVSMKTTDNLIESVKPFIVW